MDSHSTPLQRHSIRLPNYDYSQEGAYFVTICTQQRELFFDDIEIKRIAESCWLGIPIHYWEVELDRWVVMPNHLHGILILNNIGSPPARSSDNYFANISPRTKTLSVIIRTYKAAVTTNCRREGKIEFAWQRNYYERIIRNEKELEQTRQYILENPNMWNEDEENPKRLIRPS